jgi:serralysin
MSYTPATDSKILTATVKGSSTSVSQAQVSPATFMTYDIAALQYLYGANTSTTSTDTKLANIQKLNFTDSYKGIQTLWTPNGATLDASATTHKNIIDLRGGAYSSINYLGTGAAQFTNQINAAGITNSKTVADQVKFFNTQITAAYTGNNNVALAYGSKITQANGGAADDAFYVSNYTSTLVGGAGTDTVYLTGVATDWTSANQTSLLATGGTLGSDMVLTNKSTKASISLRGIEKYAFYNVTSSITKA